MLYRSLNKESISVNFETALKNGLAKDGGLFYPEKIQKLDKSFLENLHNYSNIDIAFQVIKQFIGDEINEKDLKEIIKNTIDFDFPLIDIENNIQTLELFHGPTLAFKDVGARFMANCLAYFNKSNSDITTVLVATSGDTGAAVANGFLDVKGTNVVILYPKNMVSDIQERQLTTNKKNIKAYKVHGTFDDCQQMVKKAFVDKELNSELNLTSANSINVARWLPQMFYYFFALKQIKTTNKKIVFSVPSGNFGNICAGIIAIDLGLPIHHVIASTNSNNTIPRYLKTKIYNPRKTIKTISNAMDVSNPSNFIRIEEIFNDFTLLKNNLSSYSFNDSQTISAIKSVFNNSKYILDPHGAIGYLGLKKYLNTNLSFFGVFLETAHPIKFSNHIEKALNIKIKIPNVINKIMSKEKVFTEVYSYKDFKDSLLDKYVDH
jgi:threonine synthase